MSFPNLFIQGENALQLELKFWRMIFRVYRKPAKRQAIKNCLNLGKY